MLRLVEFGADLALDPSDPAWVEQAREATGGAGVDLTIDHVSGELTNQTMQAAAGRIVNVGRLGGFSGTFEYDLHALKRIDYIGVTFRTRSVDEVRAINAAMRADLWDAVEDGTLSLPVDRTFPLAAGGRGAGAHARQRPLRQDRADGLRPRPAGGEGQPDDQAGGGSAPVRLLMRP